MLSIRMDMDTFGPFRIPEDLCIWHFNSPIYYFSPIYICIYLPYIYDIQSLLRIREEYHTMSNEVEELIKKGECQFSS